jgi:hypothetical protein
MLRWIPATSGGLEKSFRFFIVVDLEVIRGAGEEAVMPHRAL